VCVVLLWLVRPFLLSASLTCISNTSAIDKRLTINDYRLTKNY